jgi:hypothetical protein
MISKQKVTLICVIFNELFYLPAFLSHYRQLGIEQFVFIDDHSTDASVDLLMAQPDTVIVRPSMRYGDLLDGKRAGPQWKTIFPQTHLLDCWVLCVDADEFLVIEKDNIPALINRATQRGDVALAAPMVDMHPSTLDEMRDRIQADTLADLLAKYPWFDKGPYLDWREGQIKPHVISEGAGSRLLDQYRIKKTDYSDSIIQFLIRPFRPARKRLVFKVPLVKWHRNLAYLNAHTLNCAPSIEENIALLHFKFTCSLSEKIGWALERKSFNKGSRSYFALRDLLSIAESGPDLLYPGSHLFTGFHSLVEAEVVPFKGPSKIKG